jgi:hypothetical protein
LLRNGRFNDFALPRLEKLVGKAILYVVAASRGKVVLTNRPAGSA